VTPAHAMLNYLYAICESEATIASYRMGFDPALGLMHADKRYRASLASDLMEPVRPIADALVIDVLESRKLRKGEALETRKGRAGPLRKGAAASHLISDHAAMTLSGRMLARLASPFDGGGGPAIARSRGSDRRGCVGLPSWKATRPTEPWRD